MKQGLTEMVFILDRSGSMSGLESDTIGGFNSTIKKQKEVPGEALVSMVLFDDKSEVLHDRVPLSEIPTLTAKEYYARGCTALIDAMGDAIHHIGNIHKYAREEDRPEKTIFVITTDGYENASTRYTVEKVREMVEHQKKEFGWEFIFLGANIDAIATARTYGISEDRATNFVNDSKGIKKMHQAQAKLMCAMRCAPKAVLDSSWKDEVTADYVKRGNRNK